LLRGSIIAAPVDFVESGIEPRFQQFENNSDDDDDDDLYVEYLLLQAIKEIVTQAVFSPMTI
jgi:hypothetical protein